MLVACNGEDRIRLRRTKNIKKKYFSHGGSKLRKIQLFTKRAKGFLTKKLADFHLYSIMRPCTLRTPVYANPKLDIRKLYPAALERRGGR